MDNRTLPAAEVWQTAYGELQLQLPRETFDAWLRGARLIAYEDGTYIIGVHNNFAREWLDKRLKKTVVRTVGRIAGRTVEVRFVVAPEKAHRPHAEDAADMAEAGPLLATLDEQPRPERQPRRPCNLNPQHTFDTFVTGPCNQLAHAAALAIVNTPAVQFNPLYIHAGVGLGKTHLLQAIGNACHERGQRVLYVTSETFTNDMVAAIRAKNTREFRQKYREVDVLLVDDVQFLAGKESSQEEFFNTFDALLTANAQIVVTAGAPPAAIAGLDSRLRSRFEGGLVVEITPPDYPTRLEILNRKAQDRSPNGPIPLDVVERVAREVEGSVRELEGALNRLIATSLLTRSAPTVDEAEEVLEELRAAPAAGEIDVGNVLAAVAEVFGVAEADLRGRSRTRAISTARQVVMYVAHCEIGLPLQLVGDALDGRSHSTILHGCNRIEEMIEGDAALRRQVKAVARALVQQTAAVPVQVQARGSEMEKQLP
ncbi:MAG: chromosomal replication initiator protein DnaA [Chloroflexi bacterium]|nr:chromosomal replication initiator protein DnaA [Chloroflexota bacterium]